MVRIWTEQEKKELNARASEIQNKLEDKYNHFAYMTDEEINEVVDLEERLRNIPKEFWAEWKNDYEGYEDEDINPFLNRT